MFYAPNVLNAGVFDAVNCTNFGAKSGSWRDAFAYCYQLKNLYIKNLKVNLNISWSPISQESLNFILTNAINTSKITVSLSPITYYTLTDTNRQLAIDKNITLELISTNVAEDQRLNIIKIDGDGTKYLNNKGEYVTIEDFYTKSEIYTKEEIDNKGYLTSIPSEYVTETELNGKNYATTSQVNAKQDTLVSGTNIKTINGTSILGSGDIKTNKPLQTSTSTSMTLTPNVYHRNTSTSLSSLTITLGAVSDNTILNEYFVEFTTHSSGTTITLPSNIKWVNGTAPTFEASATYQISIVNNLGVVTKFK